jgi:acyl-coenzyme A synthetase/AMP-(fatty) acid ligase
MPHLPLLTHTSPEAVFAWQQGRPVQVREFLSDVQQLAAAMPDGKHVLNTCSNRYEFCVGFAAAAVSGRVSLLPSARTPDTVAQLRAIAPDLFHLGDAPGELGLPFLPYPLHRCAPSALPLVIPSIPADQRVAQVFTSGSTGTPLAHNKTWGALAHCVRAGASMINQAAGCGPLQLVGTVPPQHMYGFESTLLLALQGGAILSAAHPFYPADIAAALADVPAPRLLISTPVHLRALLASGVSLPPVAVVLCATAPLDNALACTVEQRLGAPLLEIYGSTETGQIASRRTAQTDIWTLFPGVELTQAFGGTVHAQGAHLTEPVPLGDNVERIDTRHFRLLGRHADMVNIAGKRNSLAHLNHQLLAIPGVTDGAFHMPDGDGAGMPRLMAFVVAPTLQRDTLMAALRQRIDPAFLPRPLVLLESLPRNTTGKLTRAALTALAAQCGSNKVEVRP